VKALAAIAAFPAAAAVIGMLLRTPLVGRLAAAAREDPYRVRKTALLAIYRLVAAVEEVFVVALAVEGEPE
jgi:hypothetical protein